MEIGNFLGKLKGREKVEPKKFLALILTDEVVQAAVWHVEGEATEIVALGTPVEWDGDTGTTSELITAVDATISSAVEGLDNEPNSVILGVPHGWTDKNGILGVKKEFIAKIRKELELEIIGYVVITDSILSYLKMQEGTPTTSILIQVSRDELTLVLVRLGRIEAVENIGRSDDVVEDVTEGVARFKIMDNLPSRIILFNSMHNLDEIIQNLLSVDWQSQFNFLHIPKIEALAKDVSIRALVMAGGSEVAKSMGIPVTNISKTLDQEDSVNSEVAEEIDPQEEVSSSFSESTTTPDLDFVSPEEIGFTNTEKPQIFSEPLIDTDVEPEDSAVGSTLPGQSGFTVSRELHAPSSSRSKFAIPKLKFPKISVPKFKFNLRSAKPIWWILAVVVIVLGLLIFWLLWILPSAIVTVKVQPKAIDEEIQLTLSSTESSISFADRIVPASIESVSESGEKLMETTGKKIVGDPAAGEVAIYNRTSATKTFAKGTILAASNLKFTLDQDVLVASKSAGSDYVDVPGKANVKITASAIGEDSNLSSGTEFTVMSFGKDSFVAKNDAALTGGTSEEVRVVGKDDQKNLVKELTEELLLSLTSKSVVSSVPGTGIYLIEESAKVDTVTYSAKVGESAKTLTVNLTIKASLLKYKTEDVTTLVNSSIDQAIPGGYVRADLPSTVELSSSVVSDSGESVKSTAKVKVALLPVVDKSSLQSQIKGKKGTELQNILTRFVPGYVAAEASISPSWIPTKLKSIPLNPKNITIQVKSAI